jgi:hypothetical protein
MESNKHLIRNGLLAVFLTLGISLQSQTPKKYWVRFNNKNGTPYSISNPSAFLTQQSVYRRTVFGIPVVESDLPVTPSYITQVDNFAGVQVLFASKWLNGVVISTTNMSSLAAIKALPFVSDTFKVNKYKLSNDYVPLYPSNAKALNTNQKTTSGSYNYGYSYWQNKQINVDCLHNLGFRGTGITIAVMDAGFSGVDSYSHFDSIRARGKILGTRNFVNGGNDVYSGGSHGTMVLSCMAAIKPGELIGSAPDASYWLFTTEAGGSETISEEYNWIRAAEFADSVGAHILTTSLGYTTFDDASQNHTYSALDGRTAPMSIAANLAARKGMFVVNSAGNEGNNMAWQYISVAADADSICAVGAIDSLGAYASFSGKGPTFDGRTKPDLVARGVGAWVCLNSTVVFPANGTSFSAPIIAGAVACFWQAHKSFNNITILDTLRKTASKGGNPDNLVGWGIPNMCAFPVGINEYNFDLADKINVVPNPFQSKFKVQIDEPSIKVSQLSLLDTKGSLIYQKNVNTKEALEIELPELASGFYILQLNTSSGTLSKKLLAQP